jgi:hypothetical protein
MFKISKDKLVKIFNAIFPGTIGQVLSHDGMTWLATTPEESGGLPYQLWTGYATQTGENAPTLHEIYKTANFPVLTTSRSGIGMYKILVAGAGTTVDMSKVQVVVNKDDPSFPTTMYVLDPDIHLRTWQPKDQAAPMYYPFQGCDDILSSAIVFEIRIYP